jgi:2,3-dihydroxy-p-cumate/2,3-dihydroxybenzoate 3,4-dioxygenase
MITLTDIAYVRSGGGPETRDPLRHRHRRPGAVTPTEVGVAHLRADGRHHCLALVEGPSGVISSGFAVANSDALDAAETELERSGISVHRGSPAEARSRRVREFIGFDDPFGNRVELVNQLQTVARPVAFSRAAGITEFGHLCLDAPDVHEAYRFWSTRFNARVSDWLGDAACLMRIDPVHHKLAVFRGDEPGLCHMNFQVETIDDVFRNWHYLVEHDVEIEMGPGRHPQSGAIFLYFLGPEGFTYEYSFGVRRIEDDAPVPCTFDPAEPGSIDMGSAHRPPHHPAPAPLRHPSRGCPSTARPVISLLVSGNADAGWRSISATACGTAAGS